MAGEVNGRLVATQTRETTGVMVVPVGAGDNSIRTQVHSHPGPDGGGRDFWIYIAIVTSSDDPPNS